MDRINDIELINGDVAIIFDNDEFKALKSNKYNFLFNKKDGFLLDEVCIYICYSKCYLCNKWYLIYYFFKCF